jgi:mitogen-activated protein kinase 1/3
MSRAAPQSGSRKISFNVSEQYDIQDVVGEGAYGVVCSALHKPSQQKVAIKKITRTYSPECCRQRHHIY